VRKHTNTEEMLPLCYGGYKTNLNTLDASQEVGLEVNPEKC
jgi:hypothetical protein